MKGHLGTMLLQKASDIFEVTKKDNVFTLKQTESRNKPIGDIQWIMDDNGNIARKDKDNQQIKAETRDIHASKWRQAFALLNTEKARATDLAKAYKTVVSCNSITTAYNHMKDAVIKGFICKDDEGFYALI